MPKPVERKLLVYRFGRESEPMQKINSPGDDYAAFDLSGSRYGEDWVLASHTFQLLEGGAAIVTLLLERPSEG